MDGRSGTLRRGRRGTVRESCDGGVAVFDEEVESRAGGEEDVSEVPRVDCKVKETRRRALTGEGDRSDVGQDQNRESIIEQINLETEWSDVLGTLLW